MSKTLTIYDYALNQNQIIHVESQPAFGQILTSNIQKKNGLQSIQQFKGKQILNISGGNKKIFMFQQFDQNQNVVTALHSQIQDQIQYNGLQVLPIDQIVMALQGTKIMEIKSGKFHNIILTTQGKIYAYGKGQFGALGVGGSIFQPKPRLIKKLQQRKIISIACGMHHTLALTIYGDLYSWGRGFEGQLGHVQPVQTVSSPQYVTNFFKYDTNQQMKKLKKTSIQSIACGSYHSIAIDTNGSIYCWGQARSGQTGTGKKVKQSLPIKLKIQVQQSNEQNVKIKVQRKIKMASGGFGHTLCLSQQGQLFSWGLNVNGQLGIIYEQEFRKQNEHVANPKACFFPVHIKNCSKKKKLPLFTTITCGFNTSFAIDIEGNVWSWGGQNLQSNDKSNRQRGPIMLTEGAQSKKFTKVFASDNTLVLFSPLQPLYFKPHLAPSNGDTQITFFGNGFADTSLQHAKFKIKNYQTLVPLSFDSQTNTYFCKSPNFTEANVLYPCECEVFITLDKKNYHRYDKNLLIYSSKLAMESFQPNCGSAAGNTDLKIYMPLDHKIQQYVESISVGFKSNTKQLSQNKYSDWICSQGIYSDQTIRCKLPNIPLFNNDQPFYLVDVSLNGQQFTEYHQTFRFYSITETALTPNQGFDTGQFDVLITGKGLFDTPHKMLVLQLNFIHNQQKFNCKRNVDIKWNKIEKNFTFKMPELKWIIGDHDCTPELLQNAKNNFVYIRLFVAASQVIDIGKFKFVNPPPPQQPQQDKKDSKKDTKKGGKK